MDRLRRAHCREVIGMQHRPDNELTFTPPTGAQVRLLTDLPLQSTRYLSRS